MGFEGINLPSLNPPKLKRAFGKPLIRELRPFQTQGPHPSFKNSWKFLPKPSS